MSGLFVLPGAEQAAGHVVELVAGGIRRVAITGRASAGKSTAMERIASQLARRVLRTFMPADGDDAGPVALAVLAAELGIWDQLRDPSTTWHTKLARTLSAVEEIQEPVAILVDDAWLGTDTAVPNVFAERAGDFIGGLAGLGNVTLVVSAAHAPAVLGAHVISLQASADVGRVLDPAAWPSDLQLASKKLLETADPRLQRLSPVELRFLVGLLALGWSAQQALSLPHGPRGLARALIEASEPPARRALRRLVVMRTPFDEEALNELVTGFDPTLCTSLFLFRTAEGWTVPELLRREVAHDNLGDADLRSAHRTAARFHARSFGSAVSNQRVSAAVRHEMEEIHHLTMAGDAGALLERSLCFVEQYNALGKVLGVRGVERYGTAESAKCLRLAVRAYERALEHDSEDAYAHHYLAYNLDVLGQDALRVEKEYRQALQYRPDHVWHHGRLVTFLVTRGREAESREAWDEALRQLDVSRRYEWFFRELHRPLARLLLHRGILDFAQEVLADVPAEAQGAWYRALERHLNVMREAEADRLVFPPTLEVDQRWSGGPHLVRSEEERSRVRKWQPGRIESVGKHEIVVRIAEAQDRVGRRVYTLSAFRGRCPDSVPVLPPAGTFVEALWFTSSGSEVIRCHPIVMPDPELVKPFPPPDRYLPRAPRSAR